MIIALENSVQNKLAEGKIVRLEKLGSLYPAISSTGVEKAEEVTSAVIKEAYINYRPGERLIKTLNGSGFVKVS